MITLFDEEKVLRLIQHEMTLRPNTELIDYYKMFFQGIYGPAHLIEDIDSARKYMQRELDNMSLEERTREVPFVEDIGWHGTYCRINLHAIHQGLLNFDDVFDAFIASARVEVTIPLAQWRNMWTEIYDLLLLVNKGLEIHQDQMGEIEQGFMLGEPVFHHSQRYRDLYHPHYRVMDKQQLGKNKVHKELS